MGRIRLIVVSVGLIWIALIPFTTYSQTKDSILNIANNLEGDSSYIKYIHDEIWALKHENRALAFDLLDHLENWYANHSIEYRRDANIYYFGLLHKYDGEYDKSALKFKQYLDFQIAKKDSNRIGAVYNALSNLYYDQSIFDTSMYYTTLALDIYDELKDTSTYVNMLTRKGMLLKEVGRLDEALQHQKEAMILGNGVAPPYIFANVLNNTALVYEGLNETDSTILYYKKYKDYAATHDLSRALYYAEYNLAIYLIKQKKYDESLELLQSAYTSAEELDDPNMVNFILIGLAELYNKLGNSKKALAQISALDFATLTIEHQKEMHQQAYIANKQLGYNLKALEHHEKHKTFADSMLNESVSKQIQEIEAKYETEKKEQEIQSLQLTQSANEKRLLYQRGIIILSISGISILSLLLFLLKKKNRLIKLKNKTIQNNLEQKSLLLQEIHHRVKNNLQVISSLLRLQTRSSSGNAVEALVSSESRVRSMALIHQHLYQGDDISSVYMATYLSDLTQQVVSSHISNNERINIEMDISEDISLDVNTVVPIGLITNEWLTNACKYAFSESESGKIQITFKKFNSDNYVLEIMDNGVGYEVSDDQTNGFGTRLVKAFANRINGKLSIINENGTTCRLQFPITTEA